MSVPKALARFSAVLCFSLALVGCTSDQEAIDRAVAKALASPVPTSAPSAKPSEIDEAEIEDEEHGEGYSDDGSGDCVNCGPAPDVAQLVSGQSFVGDEGFEVTVTYTGGLLPWTVNVKNVGDATWSFSWDSQLYFLDAEGYVQETNVRPGTETLLAAGEQVGMRISPNRPASSADSSAHLNLVYAVYNPVAKWSSA